MMINWTKGATRAELINVFLWHEGIYIPIMGKTNQGAFLETGELLSCPVEEEEFTRTLDEAIQRGNPRIVHPKPDKLPPPSIILKTTGYPSWKRLSRAGMMCGVVYFKQAPYAAFSTPGSSNIQVIDYDAEHQFPPNATAGDLVRHILAEWSRRDPGAGRAGMNHEL